MIRLQRASIGGDEVEQPVQKKGWYYYLFLSTGIIVTLLLIIGVVFFWDELQNVESAAYGYGYAGVFFAGILCGVSIIPAPTMILVFTFGGVLYPQLGILNPLFVGVIAGFGAALGGITVYLTGAGVETIWSRRRPKNDSRFWSRGQAFYNRLLGWIGGWGASWALFIVAAIPISPFYFAGLAAGSLRMGLARYFLISWAGKTIKHIIIALAGYGGLHFLIEWIGG